MVAETRQASVSRTFLLVLSVPFLCQLLVLAIIWSGAVVDDDTAPATAPPNLCVLLRPEMVDRLVPSSRSAAENRRNRPSNWSRATCRIESREGEDSDARASLTLELTRYGSTTLDETAIGRARYDFMRDFRNSNNPHAARPVPDLGDEALIRVNDDEDLEGRRTEVQVDVYVRSGADIVEVTYLAQPVDADRARDAAVAVAREVLSRL